MIGTRIYPDADGHLPPLLPGQYGHATIRNDYIGPTTSCNWWVICTPNGAICSLNPKVHQLTENPDGTLTVHPSIKIPCDGPELWHGYLVAGEFK